MSLNINKINLKKILLILSLILNLNLNLKMNNF
jgi:hypothetical protein